VRATAFVCRATPKLAQQHPSPNKGPAAVELAQELGLRPAVAAGNVDEGGRASIHGPNTTIPAVIIPKAVALSTYVKVPK
jgi:hypothetical protein